MSALYRFSDGDRRRWAAFVARMLTFNLLALVSLQAQQSAPSLMIRGSVQSDAQRKLGGASVTLEQVDAPDSASPGNAITARATTDDNGDFVLNLLMPRLSIAGSERAPLKFLLRAQAAGFAPYDRIIVINRTVNSASTVAETFNITLTPLALPAAEVTVTATRTPTRLSDTPSSVIVIGREELQVTAALTVDESLRQVPGFTLFRRGGSRFANPTTQGVSLRGTGASGAGRALVVRDGIPLTDPFGGWVYWGRVPRASLAQIEVLRGAASDLYGSGALGGVIAATTRAVTQPFEYEFETSYGGLNTADATLWLGARRGKWSGALAAEGFRSDGYILVAENERGAVDTAAASRRRNLELTLERNFGKAVNPDQSAHRVFLRGAYYGEERNNGTRLQINDTRIRSLSAGVDGALPFVGAYSLRIYGGTQLYQQTFTAIAADRNSENLTRAQRTPAQNFGVSALFVHSFGARQTLIGGGEMRDVRGASDEIIYQTSVPSSAVGAGGRERTFGIFLNDSLHFMNSRLTVTGGVRFDHWRDTRGLSATRSLLVTNAPTLTTAFPARGETAFSPRLAVLYQLSNNISVVASAARAFRQPTLNELYRAFRVGNVLTQANATLNAERLTGVEAGARFALLNNRFNARAVFFENLITRPVANVTLSVTPALITRQRQNLGSTRTRGLEAESEFRLTERFAISGGYLFAAARVREFAANPSLVGLQLPQVARHQATLQARYTHPTRLTFGVQLRAASQQFDDDQNLLSLRSYYSLDALFAFPLAPHLEVFAAGENLTDARIETGRTPVTTLGAPRFIRFGIRLRAKR